MKTLSMQGIWAGKGQSRVTYAFSSTGKAQAMFTSWIVTQVLQLSLYSVRAQKQRDRDMQAILPDGLGDLESEYAATTRAPVRLLEGNRGTISSNGVIGPGYG